MQFKHLEARGFKFDEKNRIFEGYASAFNKVDSYGDTIIPGAYAETIKREEGERKIKMRWNHFGPVIGKWLEMKEDDFGLWVKGMLTPGHSVAEDTYASLLAESIDGLSIGWWAENENMVKNKHGGYDLHKIELHEISVVEDQADLYAAVGSVKQHIESLNGERDIERFLRDEANLSVVAAKALISRIKSGHRDDDAGIIDCAKLELKF